MNLQEEKAKIQSEIDEIDRRIALVRNRGGDELLVKNLATDLLRKIAPGKHLLPILQSIIIGEGFARATNLEVELKVPLETEGKGQFCINPNVLPKEAILTLKYKDGDQVMIQGEKVTATTNADDPLDFPPEPKVGETQPLLEVGAQELSLAIREVAGSAATEDIRPVLTGIYFEVGENLTLTTADGFRLATTSLSCSVASQGTLLLPAKAAKLIPLLEGSLQFQHGEEACVVVGNKGQLTIKTIQGNYPNYRHIIPDESEMATTVIFQSKELVNGIKVVANGVANLRLYPEANAVKLVAKENDGSREYLCPAMVSGSGKIAVNPRFLHDLAKLSDSLTLSWGDPTKAMRAQTTRGLHVIMPLFVQWESDGRP